MSLLRAMIGSRRDWRFDRLRLPRMTGPSVSWVGPLLALVSALAGWFAFAGAGGGASVAFGLFIGSVSIVLMAWSFILSIRIRFLEPLFGGLDGMYRVHRWAGTLSVVAMALHTSIEPEIVGGIRGAAAGIADAASELAGAGEVMIYGLLGVTLLRWIPYRYWRWTHKLFGIPFAFACWHFYTAEKTFANTSGWGTWFLVVMAAGLIAYVARVIGRNAVMPGTRHRIVSADQTDTTTELVLEPVGRRLRFKAGQFAFLKVQAKGMSEPHAFTIASSPSDPNLRFFARELGDWTRRLREQELIGAEVIVEGPYGTFAPTDPDASTTVWLAGGVGITPFLAALDGLAPAPDGHRPTLLYSVRERQEATAIEDLEAAAEDGRIDLHVFASADGNRLTPERFRAHVPARLDDAHVAMCGPSGLLSDMAVVARALGAHQVETEDFDLRQGFGPDLSVPIDDLISSRT